MLQRRVDDRARLLGIEVAHQLGRALDVREQRRDRLALALQTLRRLPLMSDYRRVEFSQRRQDWATRPARPLPELLRIFDRS